MQLPSAAREQHMRGPFCLSGWPDAHQTVPPTTWTKLAGFASAACRCACVQLSARLLQQLLSALVKSIGLLPLQLTSAVVVEQKQ